MAFQPLIREKKAAFFQPRASWEVMFQLST